MASVPARPPRLRRVGLGVVVPVGIAALLLVTIVAAGIGQNEVPPLQVLGSLLHHLHVPWGPLPDQVGEDTLWNVRLPRVMLALLVGAALGCAGAVLQGIFANPLAEPGIIGVSSGAATGATGVILVGGLGVAGYAVAGGAFLGGLVTTALVYLMSRSAGRTEVITLILTGIAVNAFAGGLIAFFTFRAAPTARDQIVFWQLGSLNRASWDQVYLVVGFVVIGAVASLVIARQMDLLALGEYSARHLGVDVERLRRIAVVVVAVLTAAAVAFCGIILFVGLVIPHLMRMVVGPTHRVLIPASLLAGAVLLVLADLAARTIVGYADLPIGMLTSLVGGPVFLLLLRRTRSRQGGWT
ncbi:FecCD family ABC transporter permease [Williamsia sterculiae]|uniref:Iron complex transport system permease protein n=1 Tax=Williamsia sterculiae TaxID=1344003 RepID=A0A1N7GRV1_9NOCA|nr:iron ABC transporter permease [Williamsia sterculiae]SIS15178.1 iron complex transport system permease protein [Williamsia sterculiae]